jgi:hypothetical protein
MATPTSLPATFVAGNVLTAAQMNSLRGAFRILQVVSTTKDDTFSASLAAGAAATVTGLSATITPSSTSSKILVSVNMNGSSGVDYPVFSFLTERDGSPIGVGATAGSRTSVSGSSMAWVADTRAVITASSEYLDAPASTSALTYTVDILNVSGATRTVYVNRSHDDNDALGYSRAISTITLMEVSA